MSKQDLVSLEPLYDEDSPDSLINRLPPRLVSVFERVKSKMPKTLLSDERSVRRYTEPDDRDERLRLSFWDEYNVSTAAGKKMSLQSLISGACSWDTWVALYEPNDKKMCWIFTPPASYVNQMRHILHRGTERLLEIINLPMITSDGKVDVRVATLVLKAWQLADMRIKGGVMQKVQIEQKSMNVNVNEDLRGLDLRDLEVLDARLERAKNDSRRYFKNMTEEQRTLIMGGGELLNDLENRTMTSHRLALPNLPDLPEVEIDVPEPKD